jgi:hypothetical protein
MYKIDLSQVVGIEQVSAETPVAFSLEQNYPNPFNPSTKIRYNVMRTGRIVIDVFDITGKKVSTLVDNAHSPGSYEVEFNAGSLSSGVYLYSLRAADALQEVKRMTLLK